MLLRHCTVTDNLLTELGSPWYPWSAAVSIGFGGPVELQNCLIAENPTSEEPDAAGISGTWIDGGGNVIGGAAGLGVLRDNGGPTFTMLPFPGSPAINAGVASESVTDARGLSRVAGAAPDAGAVEVNASAPADSDGDGIPDVWESFHSLNSSNSTDAASDTDADGRSALDEFRGRTDPNDSQSFMRIEEFAIISDFSDPSQRFVLLKWRPVPGVTYRVETSADLQHWRPASGYTQLDIIQPNIIALRFAGVAESSIAFYRLTTAEDAAD